jgi:hypothetical protein
MEQVAGEETVTLSTLVDSDRSALDDFENRYLSDRVRTAREHSGFAVRNLSFAGPRGATFDSMESHLIAHDPSAVAGPFETDRGDCVLVANASGDTLIVSYDPDAERGFLQVVTAATAAPNRAEFLGFLPRTVRVEGLFEPQAG